MFSRSSMQFYPNGSVCQLLHKITCRGKVMCPLSSDDLEGAQSAMGEAFPWRVLLDVRLCTLRAAARKLLRFKKQRFALTILAVGLFAQSGGDDATTFVRNTKRLSILNLEAVAGSFRNSDLSVFVSKSDLAGATFSHPYADKQFAQFQHMLADRAAADQEFASQNKAAKTALSYMEFFAGAGDSGELLVPEFAAKATETFFDSFIEKLAKEREEAGLTAVSSFYDSRKFDPKKLENARNGGTDAFIEEVKSQAGVNRSVLGQLGDKESRVALERLGDFTLAAVASNSLDVKQLRNASDAKFKDLYQRFAKSDRQQQSVLDELKAISTDTRKNTEELQRLSTAVAQQHGDITAIETMLFRKSSASEQLEILSHKGALGLDEKNRNALIANVQDRARIVENAKKWNDFISVGMGSVQLLNKLGIDPHVVDGLQRTFTAAQTMHASIEAALNGNYLGAVTAIAGLFGVAGQSPEAQRHAEIMAQLAVIIQNQQKIMKMIGDLADMIQRYDQKILSRLESIYALQGETLKAVLANANAGLTHCIRFRDGRRAYGYSLEAGRFNSYEQLSQHFAAYAPNYQQCRNLLDQVLTLSNINFDLVGLPAIEARRADSVLDSRVLPPYKKIILPYRTYLDNFVDDKGKYIGSFYFPSANYQELARKTEYMKSAEGAKELANLAPASSVDFGPGDARQTFFFDYFFSFLSPEALGRYVDEELTFNRYIELTSGNRTKLVQRAELVSNGGNIAPAVSSLRNALDWTDLAIAQQSVMMGDSLAIEIAPLLFREFNAAKAPLDFLGILLKADDLNRKDKQVALAQYMAGQNITLLQNAIRIRLYQRMKEKGFTPFAYAFASGMTGDPTYMNILFGGQPRVEWKENPKDEYENILPSGWYFDYAYIDTSQDRPVERKVKLVHVPDVSEVQRYSFFIPKSMKDLQRRRAQLIRRLLDSQLEEAANKQDKLRDLKLLLISNAKRKELPERGGTKQ